MDIHLTEDELAQVKQLAGLFFSPREIAMMLGIPNVEGFAEACRRRPVYAALHDAYHGGKLQEEMLLRKAIVDLAKKGSSPAQTAVVDFIKNVNARLQER